MKTKTVIMLRFFFSGFIFFSIALPFILLPRRFHFKFLAPIFNKLYLFAPKVRMHNLTSVEISSNQHFIYASNHKCFADFCFITSCLIRGPFTILIRSDLMKNIFFKFITWKMGFISINRSNVLSQLKALNKAKTMIAKHKYSLIIFPEGWYDFDRLLGRLRKGIIKLAVGTNVNIVPVGIYGISEKFVVQKKLVWKDVYLKAGKPIDHKDFENSEALLKHLESEIKKLYYEIEMEVSTGVNIN